MTDDTSHPADGLDGHAAEMVAIDRRHLELLLHYAQIGDRKTARRSWRNWGRRMPTCSMPDHRQPDCRECEAFAAVEAAIRPPGQGQ